LHGLSERANLRLVYQQMHVLRHDNVSVHAEGVVLSNSLQGGFKDSARNPGAIRRGMTLEWKTAAGWCGCR
jgi:hypothetical protein